MVHEQVAGAHRREDVRAAVLVVGEGRARDRGPGRVAQLAKAVAARDETWPASKLEATGGITLDNVAEVAETGVDFISIGALTHSAPSLDVSLLLNPLS